MKQKDVNPGNAGFQPGPISGGLDGRKTVIGVSVPGCFGGTPPPSAPGGRAPGNFNPRSSVESADKKTDWPLKGTPAADGKISSAAPWPLKGTPAADGKIGSAAPWPLKGTPAADGKIGSAAPCGTMGCRYWHNESERRAWWPFDAAIDGNYVRKLYSLYGAEINLVEKFYLWEDYYLSQSLKKRANPRGGFHRWCIKGVALKKKFENMNGSKPHGRSPGVPASTPGGREAGNAAPASGIDNVNALATDIAAARTGLRPSGATRTGVSVPPRGKPAIYPQLTQEELEERRREQLRIVKGMEKGGKHK
jgi:hypothetical protein